MNQGKYNKVNTAIIKKETKWYNLVIILPVFLSIFSLSESMVINLGLSFFLYPTVFISLILLLLFTYEIKINKFVLPFIITTILSLLFNYIPDVFKSYQRFVAWLGVFILYGPLIRTPRIDQFRSNLFSIITNINQLLILISFLFLLGNLSISYGRGGFIGVYKHSMILGPMASICFLTTLYKFYIKKSLFSRIFLFVLLIISTILILKAGSRLALVGCIIASLYFIYRVYKESIVKFTRILLLIFISSFLSFPLWKQYTDRLVEKMEYSYSNGGLSSSRDSLWKSRFDEFYSSPVNGIGFASVFEDDPRLDKESGVIEPGSSWLIILSMTGILGALAYIIFIGYFLWKLFFFKDNDIYIDYITSILLFFEIHMIGEGYLFSSGSLMVVILWLTFSQIQCGINKLSF